MDDVQDGDRTPGVSPGQIGARESRTQLGKPVTDNNVNSDTGPTNWEERFKAQRELTRKIEAQKNEALKQRDELLSQREKSNSPKTESTGDPLSSAIIAEIRKLNARFDEREREDYVKNAVISRGLPEQLTEKLKDLAPDKVDAILDALPEQKKIVVKPDSASVTGAADSPPGSKRTYTAADLKTMSRGDRLKAYEAGLIVDAEGNSITKQ